MTTTELLWPAIAQVGPDPAAVGGIETVIRTYVDLLSPHTTVELIPTWRPDAAAAGVGPAMSALRRLAALPAGTLVHVHVSHRGAFLREGALIRAAARAGRPVFITVHGSGFVASSERPHWERIYRSVLGRAGGVAVLNEPALAAVERLVPRTPVMVLPNPGPVPDDWHPECAAGDAEPVAVFAGEVSHRKGADVLLGAWPAVRAAVPEARLLVAGPPTGVDVGGVAGVHKLGSVSPERVRELLGASRLAVLPSRAEGMPMFVLEAMAAGRPVVGTTVGAMPRMLADAGTVVPPGDVDALAAALIAYLGDRERAGTEGATGKARYKAAHSPAATLRQLAAFYGVVSSGR